jgi:antitoxin VapB
VPNVLRLASPHTCPGHVQDGICLNLKNPRANSLVSQLSELTGETLTAVVITALEQRLKAERRKRGGCTTAEKMLAFAERFAPGMAPGAARWIMPGISTTTESRDDS